MEIGDGETCVFEPCCRAIVFHTPNCLHYTKGQSRMLLRLASVVNAEQKGFHYV